MSDLISRQAALEICADELLHAEDYSPIRTWNRIQQLPSAQPEPQWIPCSESLPDTEEDVLCDDDGRVTIGYYTDEEIGWHDMHSYRIYPEAWMQLPAPYQEKQDA